MYIISINKKNTWEASANKDWLTSSSPQWSEWSLARSPETDERNHESWPWIHLRSKFLTSLLHSSSKISYLWKKKCFRFWVNVGLFLSRNECVNEEYGIYPPPSKSAKTGVQRHSLGDFLKSFICIWKSVLTPQKSCWKARFSKIFFIDAGPQMILVEAK